MTTFEIIEIDLESGEEATREMTAAEITAYKAANPDYFQN